MKRLTPARDRELRHAAGQNIVWRGLADAEEPYAWCRICGRDATKQMDWLADSGYITTVSLRSYPVINLAAPMESAVEYLRRYPR